MSLATAGPKTAWMLYRQGRRIETAIRGLAARVITEDGTAFQAFDRPWVFPRRNAQGFKKPLLPKAGAGCGTWYGEAFSVLRFAT